MRALDGDTGSGEFFRADGTRIMRSPPKARIWLEVNRVLSGLRVRPNVIIVSNREELKGSNPELYNDILRARPDFESVKASGFSFRGNVILFSDLIKTPKHARFVIAHETLGHFGLRAFLPAARLRQVMKMIYEQDGHIRAAAKRKVEAGYSIEEAVEEVLADRAAALDISLIKRVWDRIKGVLERMFGREENIARYVLWQSRRNLKTGGIGVAGARNIADNMARMRRESAEGRYSREGVEANRADLFSTLSSSYGMNKNAGPFGGITGWKETVRGVKNSTIREWMSKGGKLLEKIQSLDNAATRSEGLSAMFRVFQTQTARVRRLLSRYAEIQKETHTPNWIGGEGVTTKELEKAGELCSFAALNRSMKFNLGNYQEDLFFIDNGVVKLNERLLRRLKAQGNVTFDDFEKGIITAYMPKGAEEPLGEWGWADEKHIYRSGSVNNKIRKVYAEQREAVDLSALDVLEAAAQAVVDQAKEVHSIGESLGIENDHELDLDMHETLDALTDTFRKLYSSGARYNEENIKIFHPAATEEAEAFLDKAITAMSNEPAANEWLYEIQTGSKDTLADARYRPLVEGFRAFNDLQLPLADQDRLRNAVKQIYLLEVQKNFAEPRAKQTIGAAYVPFTRRGDYQVSMKITDANGKPATLPAVWKSVLPYFMVSNIADAKKVAAALNDTFGDKFYDFGYQKVRFEATYSHAAKTQAMASAPNIGEVLDLLNEFGINLKTEDKQNLIKALAKQEDLARRSLQRIGAPGWNRDVVRGISEFLEIQAHVAGKIWYRHRLRNILNDKTKWRGSKKKLDRLHANMLRAEQTGGPEKIQVARNKYDMYASMYRYSADVGGDNMVTLYGRKRADGSRTEVSVPTEGRGNYYKDQANRLVAFYANAANIEQSTEDLLSKGVGSKLKLIAVLSQLGGSVATAIVNSTALLTHAIPYLASYNPARGYGGGYGFTESFSHIFRAVRNLKNSNMAEYGFTKNLKENPRIAKRYGLTQQEAAALHEATAEGVLQAAQFNALVGTARGGVHSNRLASSIKAWMSMFSYTEQLNRRATFMATWRMEYARRIAAGEAEADAASAASVVARKAVNTSQGEYAMYNRPEMARGNILQYLFMYKQFPIITVQLLKGMGPKGKLAFLGMMLLTSGLKGVPFADDMSDLLDTILQTLGIGRGSVEKWLDEFIDSVAPGATPTIMHGLIDQFSSATVSTRMGMGDLIPLSGALKAGVDPWREAVNFLGPVWSAGAGAVQMSNDLVHYGANVIGLGKPGKSLSQIIRESPITALRAMGDSMTYLTDGRITTPRGTVISENTGTAVALTRLMGFYPSSAARVNDVVRLARASTDYAKAVKASYVQAWVRAKMNKDGQKMNEVVQMVRDFNQTARGTEMEIKGFMRSAIRSWRSAKTPLAKRFRKASPTTSRKMIDNLLEMYGLEPESL